MTETEFKKKFFGPGGRARARSLTKKQRKAIATKAANARWNDHAGNSHDRRKARRAASR